MNLWTSLSISRVVTPAAMAWRATVRAPAVIRQASRMCSISRGDLTIIIV